MSEINELINVCLKISKQIETISNIMKDEQRTMREEQAKLKEEINLLKEQNKKPEIVEDIKFPTLPEIVEDVVIVPEKKSKSKKKKSIP